MIGRLWVMRERERESGDVWSGWWFVSGTVGGYEQSMVGQQDVNLG